MPNSLGLQQILMQGMSDKQPAPEKK